MTHTSIIESDDEQSMPIYLGTGDATNIEDKVGALYGKAVETYPTYETMVQTSFSAAMRSEFGEDENANPDVSYAFAFAREAFDYLSPDELEKANADAAAEGICSHGLTSSTCPCGCFDIE